MVRRGLDRMSGQMTGPFDSRRERAVVNWDLCGEPMWSGGKRGYIERPLAVPRSYHGLTCAKGLGPCKVWRHTLHVCTAVLTMAWLAVDLRRPNLKHSKSRSLAPS